MKQAVLITGASGAIGRAIARKLARAGYSLYLHYHQNEDSITELIAEFEREGYSGEYIPIKADLRKQNEALRLSQSVFQLHGIIHNCGISVNKLLTLMTDEEIQELLALHVTSPIMITKYLIPKLIKQKQGNIIFISSIWGQTGASCETVYSAAKGAQIAFVKALAKELAPSKIRVNCVAPGFIQSPINQNLAEEEIDELIAEIPLGRAGTPEDVAAAVHFLLSDAASYITGQVLGINGGWYI